MAKDFSVAPKTMSINLTQRSAGGGGHMTKKALLQHPQISSSSAQPQVSKTKAAQKKKHQSYVHSNSSAHDLFKAVMR